MTDLIQIDCIQPRQYEAAGELMAYGFGHKFLMSTSLSMSELASVFEQLLHHYPKEPGSLRVVARENDVVLGTMALKWKVGADEKSDGALRNFKWWNQCNHIGNGKLLRMMSSLQLLKHKPEAGECYIEDIVVHPQHQSKGIGRQLVVWAQQYMQQSSRMSYLSLHVASHNLKAIQMYERHQFHTHISTKSWLTGLLLGEHQWHYMICKGDDNA